MSTDTSCEEDEDTFVDFAVILDHLYTLEEELTSLFHSLLRIQTSIDRQITLQRRVQRLCKESRFNTTASMVYRNDTWVSVYTAIEEILLSDKK